MDKDEDGGDESVTHIDVEQCFRVLNDDDFGNAFMRKLEIDVDPTPGDRW